MNQISNRFISLKWYLPAPAFGNGLALFAYSGENGILLCGKPLFELRWVLGPHISNEDSLLFEFDNKVDRDDCSGIFNDWLLPCWELEVIFDDEFDGIRIGNLLVFKFILFENIWRRLFNAGILIARNKKWF